MARSAASAAVRSALCVPRVALPLSSCQAHRPAMRNEVVRAEASSLCASRYGNEGLKITAHQSRAKNSPLMISCPVGVCIHEFKLRIQNADSVVPKATSEV